MTNAGFWCGSEDFRHGQVLLVVACGRARQSCGELETSPAAALLGQG